jgi:iron complex outermembrane receptor protein
MADGSTKLTTITTYNLTFMNKYLRSLKPILLSIGMLLAGTSLFAQQIVTGVVTGSDTKETLPGVNIVVKGTTKGVITDLDGKYTIELQK